MPTLPTIVRERATVAEAVQTIEGRKDAIVVTLITPGQGSSGYYSADVLEAAATDRVFPATTLMFLDHASESEAFDRPERSVKDVGAILTSDATWDGTALKAEAKLIGPWAETLAEMREAIGVSISAAGTVAEGQVTKLSPAVNNSVDFVTYPGRGGSFALMESARPTRVNARAIGHGVSEATANDTREALQTALAERFGGEKVYLWVRDFDEATVWYWRESATEDATYALGYTISSDGAVTLSTDQPTEVTARTSYVPVNPAEVSTTTEESTMPQIEESRLAQLEADAGRVREADTAREAAETKATEAEARATKAETELAESKARDTARPLAVAEMAKSTSLPPTTQARLVTEAVATVGGELDAEAFGAACTKAREAAETELAEAMAAAGVGRVSGFGGSGQTIGGEQSGTDDRELAEAARAELFGRKATTEKGA